ncbi:retention module-containing protein [Cellvibrio polysaccharolyticus]|uniref:Tandem-95 repeat protein n=1 Tax=Cellvibrio polysaccharolyticus TaxID=2082724 RepID=A0A928YT37_9GAMM|nr:retention module-containing protein [Cellvibrio polysaccharolyticus]MBE8717131.1 tandem-95 repeat protein [Cellvibrio polysaccharolyticus]
MANSVATVAFIEGKVWAKSADGSMRLLAQGDVLNADEVVITAEGARVELDFGDGQAVALAGGQEVGLGPDLWEVSVTDRNEAEIVDETVEQVLALLEQDGDLLEELEETAAGGNDAGAGGGNSFVQVDRASLDSPIDPSYAFGEVFRATGTGTLIAEGVNQAPEAENQLISSPEDTPVSGRIIATDLENDTLTWSLLTPPQNGTLTLNPQTGEFIYTPNPDFNGADSFVVVISDPRGNSTTARVDLDITPVNDAPTSQDLTLVTPEDTPISGRVDAQDPDGDPLTWVIQNPPTNGTVVIDPNTGEFVYTPNPDYNGGDSFVVIISDGNGGTTTSTVVIEVTPVNDAPESNNQNLTTPQDTPIDGQIIATDRDGDELNYGVNNPPTNGTVTLNPVTGEFTYTPNPGYNGGDSFVVIISDGNGGTTTSTVTIGVTPVAEPPVVEPPVVEPPIVVINTPPVTNNLNLTTPEDTPVSGRVTASDVDGDRLTFTVSGGPANGSITFFNPALGSFVYQPGPGYTGSDQFTVTVSDGRGGFAVAVVTIGVTPDTVVPPVNQNPIADDQSLTTDENQPVDGTIAATDPDGDTLGYTLTGQPSNGTVTVNPTTGEFTYTPNTGYTGSDSFIVTVSDGKGGTDTATVTIGVIPEVVVPPVNQNPVADDQSLTTDENQPVDGTIAATDPDGDTLGYTLTGQPSNGTVTVNPTTGEFTYTPNTGYTGNDSFVVTVSDGKGGTDTATVTIGVTPGNEPPVAVNDPAGSPYSVALGTVAAGASNAAASWKVADSSGTGVKVTAYNADGSSGKLIFDGWKMGVDGTPRTVPAWAKEEPRQIEYDITTGKSESVVIQLNGNVTTATFGVANLIHNEQGGAEQGVWTAYYKGNLVASESFHFVGKSAGDVTINTGGKVFDSVRFSALDNLGNTGAGDGSGYYLTSFSASGSAVANNDYTVDKQGKLTVDVNKGLLVNDSDPDGDALVVSQINGQAVNNGSTVTLASGALLTINSDGSFSYDVNGKFSNLAAGTLATDSFTYEVSDGKGGYAEAVATVTIIGTGPGVPDAVAQSPSALWGAETLVWSLDNKNVLDKPEKNVLSSSNIEENASLQLSDMLQDEKTDALTSYLQDANSEVDGNPVGDYQRGEDSSKTDQTIALQNSNLNTHQDVIQQLTSGSNLID